MMYNSTTKDDCDEVLKLSKNASDELGDLRATRCHRKSLTETR